MTLRKVLVTNVQTDAEVVIGGRDDDDDDQQRERRAR